MIVLDTHIWVWWVHTPECLTEAQAKAMAANEDDVIGVSAISCWEIAGEVIEGERIEVVA